MGEVEIPNPEEIREIREKKFTKSVALVTAVFAVFLAITSLGGSNASKEMILAQQQASNQWAFYQAKAMREHLYHNNRIQIQMNLLLSEESVTPEVKAKVEQEIVHIGNEEERFRKEKKDIQKEAHQLEINRDKSMLKDPYFDYAEVLLQISIVLASISIISVSPIIFYIAAVVAVLGTVLSVNGFLLLFSLPFLG